MVQKKKKVMHLVESFGGGVYVIVKAIAEKSCDEFDVTIVYSRRAQTPEDFEEVVDKRIHLIPLQNFTRSINLRKDLKAYFETKKILREVDPDILHVHSSKAGIIGRMAGKSHRCKVLFTPHGYAFLQTNASFWKRTVYKFVEKAAAALFGGTTVACSFGEYEIASGITKHAMYINNGIDISSMPQPQNRKKEKLRFCTMGRVCAQKNPEAFNYIAQSFPEYEFVWIGNGELEYLLTSSNITVTSWMNQNDAMEVLKECDVFILYSLWEGLSLALLEAMYLKCICITTKIPGTKNVIKNGTNGFFAENVEEYVKLIRRILHKEYDLEKISSQAHEDVLNKFTVDGMCREYCDLYRKL